MSYYTIYRWTVVSFLILYLLLLPRITKPGRSNEQGRVPAGRLRLQIIAAGLCTAFFGLLTGLELWVNLTRRETSDWQINLVEHTPIAVVLIVILCIFDVAVPLLFALSIRWIRRCTLEWHSTPGGN
jgi:hypothetical protein